MRLTNMLKILLGIFVWLLLPAAIAQNSVFENGVWHKIGITEPGLYKIDASFLSGTMGINLSSFDPRTLKVYGVNGGMLPQSNAHLRFNDPPENSIMGYQTNDGSMDPNDYFLFYAEGPDQMDFGNEGEIIYEKNIYSDTAYYFITYGGSMGKRISMEPSANQNGKTISTFHDIITHESDEINLQGSGRYWFGNEFSSSKTLHHEFHYETPGLKDSLSLYIDLVSESEGPCSFDISLNGSMIDQIPFDSVPTGPGTTYTIRGREKQKTYSINNLTTESIDLSISFNRSNALLSRGYIDYFLLTYERDLALYDQSTKFQNLLSINELNQYQVEVSEAENVHILKVTDPLNIHEIEYQKVGTKAIFNHLDTIVNEFVAFQGSDFPRPTYIGEIENQNLKGSSNFDGLIITAKEFLAQANRLKDFHQLNDKLSVKVVLVDKIYEEFSSGRKDLTAIRDYVKYSYEQGNRLKYVLLFGDCSYDYKYSGSKFNFIPIYESREVYSPIYSYSSDDYIGFLEEDEGEWIENTQNDHTMEVGVGRIPARTEEEAEIAVDKIIRYVTSIRTLGKWRNEIIYFADDGDNNIHMRHAVTLSNIVNDSSPQYRSRKIFLDNYSQNLIPRESSPAATKALEDAVADGALVLNFIGHGNEYQWMNEATLTDGTIQNFSNRHKMPLFVTATCEFGKYDQPIVTSGAEKLLFHPNGGAIALITTTRPVYAHTNLVVNEAFHKSLIGKIDNQHPRLGDIIRETKNNSLSGPINRNFALLGDPMLRLNYPSYDIVLEEPGSLPDTLSALEEYTVKGAIIHLGDTVKSFNGQATVTILDIPQERITKGQENPKFSYKEFSNALFRGNVSVQEGLFTSTFILPKNISYKLEKGKINVYAWSEDDFIDATGANTNMLIGGTAKEFNEDDTPPSIKMYINDESFVSGDELGPSSLFIAEINDDHGINVSSNGFNQNITLTLNDEEPIIVNDFYTAGLDDYKHGNLVYPLQNLEPGKYQATLKVWDTYNNSSEKTVEFYVSSQPRLRLYNVMNYPNPVYLQNQTTFSFEHDRQGEELMISIEIFDIMGSLKFNSDFSIDDSLQKVDDLIWNLRNNNGGQIEQGTYLYRLKVTSTLDGASNETINRLVIIN